MLKFILKIKFVTYWVYLGSWFRIGWSKWDMLCSCQTLHPTTHPWPDHFVDMFCTRHTTCWMGLLLNPPLERFTILLIEIVEIALTCIVRLFDRPFLVSIMHIYQLIFHLYEFIPVSKVWRVLPTPHFKFCIETTLVDI